MGGKTAGHDRWVGEVGLKVEVPIETPELVLSSMSKLVGGKKHEKTVGVETGW